MAFKTLASKSAWLLGAGAGDGAGGAGWATGALAGAGGAGGGGAGGAGEPSGPKDRGTSGTGTGARIGPGVEACETTVGIGPEFGCDPISLLRTCAKILWSPLGITNLLLTISARFFRNFGGNLLSI